MANFRTLALASLGFMLSTTPTLAQTMSPADQSAVQLAINRGQQIRAFDQAAWHATDALMADAKAQGRLATLSAQFGGWIVRELDPQTLEVLFFDRQPDAPRPIYAARLPRDGSRVLSAQFAAEDAQIIDPLTLRMIRARQSALDLVGGEKLLRCTKEPYNIAVLPPETPDGPVPVYILTPQSDLTHVPFGGHARVMVATDGTAEPIHAFTKSCMEMPTHAAKDAPKGLVATQLLDPVPTEIDVFTMLAAGLPLYIGTPDQRIWVIASSDGQATVRLLPPDSSKR